jgi:hypothetical protein
MDAKILQAHFDGNQILLDEPFVLEPNTALLVTVLPRSQDEDRENGSRLAMECLAGAYGDNEPGYSLDSIKQVNPDYDAG